MKQLKQLLLVMAIALICNNYAQAQTTPFNHYSEWMAYARRNMVYTKTTPPYSDQDKYDGSHEVDWWRYDDGLMYESILDTYEYYKTRGGVHGSDLLSGVERYLNKSITGTVNNLTGTVENLKITNFTGKDGEKELDDMRPGRLVYKYCYTYDHSENSKIAVYKAACKAVIDAPAFQDEYRVGYSDGHKDFPWQHKASYTQQVWLDGIFMGIPFWTLAGPHLGSSQKSNWGTNATKFFDDAVRQMQVTDSTTYVSSTGLWCHAWDYTKTKKWADCDNFSLTKPTPTVSPETKSGNNTGRSLHTWGRALGWYAMAIMETMDNITAVDANYAKLNDMKDLFKKVMDAVISYRDETSGVWYCVLDVGDNTSATSPYNPDNYPVDKKPKRNNYLEATCSSMFAYCLLHGVAKGYLPSSYLTEAKNAYKNVVSKFITHDSSNNLYLNSCMQVGGLDESGRDGTFAYYMSEDTIQNDSKGVGPFIWASLEAEKIGYNMETNSFDPIDENTIVTFAWSKASDEITQGTSYTSPTFTARSYGNDTPLTNSSEIVFESSDPLVATVAADGTVTPVGIGTATITAALKTVSKYTWSGTNPTYTITVNAPDVTAPTLSSSTPTSGAINVSTSGTIVLTFSEDVACTTNATLTPAGGSAINLTPTVSGTTVTYSYSGLTNSTSYTFNLPANSVADLSGNNYTSAINIEFTTEVASSSKIYTFDDGVELATDWDVTTTVPTGGEAVCEITNSLSGAGFSAKNNKYLGLAYKNQSNVGITITTTATYSNITEISIDAVAGDNSRPTFAAYIVTTSGDVELFAAIGSKDGFSTGGTNKWGNKTITLGTPLSGKLKIVTTASSSGKYAALDNISITTQSSTPPTPSKVATPVITGTTPFSSSTSVTMSCETTGATIHYTTDGSAPTSSSATYSEPINISATTTVKAIAVKEGMTNSEVASKTFTQDNTVPTVTMTTPSATTDVAINTSSVVLTVSEEVTAVGEDIAGTFNGSAITFTRTNATHLTYNLPNLTNSTTYNIQLNANQIHDAAGNKNAETSFSFTTEAAEQEQVATPSITGTTPFTDNTTVTITCATTGATIHYTIDGTAPTASSATYSSPIAISATTTVKAIAVKSGMTDSEIASQTFTKDNTAPTVSMTTPATTTNVATSTSSVVLTVSEEVTAVGESIAGTFNGSAITFTLTDATHLSYTLPTLANSTTYTIALNANQIQDAAGNQNAAANFSFTTVAASSTNTYSFGFNQAILTAYDSNGTLLSNPSNDGTVIDISSYGSDAALSCGDAYVTSASTKEKCVSISNDASQNYGQNYVEINSTEDIKSIYLVAAVTGSTSASEAVAVGWTGTPSATISEYHTFTTPGKGDTSGKEITINFTTSGIKYVRLYRKIKLDSSTKTTFTNTSSTTIPSSGATYGIAFIKVTTQTGSSSPTYTITATSNNNEYGTVSTSQTTAAEGATVTITTTPASGYELTALTAKDASNNDVTITNNQFTMPASNVTVNATFAALPPVLGAVTFSPASGNYSSEQNVTISATNAEEIWYSTVSQAAAVKNGANATQYTSAIHIGEGTTTLYATAYLGESTTTGNATYTVTIPDVGDGTELYTFSMSGSTINFANGDSDNFSITNNKSCEINNSNIKFRWHASNNEYGQFTLTSKNNIPIYSVKLEGTIEGDQPDKTWGEGETVHQNVAVTNGTYAPETMTWTANSNNVTSVTFTNNFNSSANGNIFINKIIITYLPITTTISSAKYATYVTPAAIDFTQTEGITAFKVTATSPTFILTEVNDAPANTPVVLKGEANTYTLHRATEDLTSSFANNQLRASDGTVVGDESTIYVLGKVNGVVGFGKLRSGTILAAGKAYLLVSAQQARNFYSFNDAEIEQPITTGLNGFSSEGLLIDDDTPLYNLSGQRVSKSYKGIVIINGKKVLRK